MNLNEAVQLLSQDASSDSETRATAISNNNGVLLQKQTPIFCRKISKPYVPVSWKIYFNTVKLSW